jgi:signal transduction histidine kinase
MKPVNPGSRRQKIILYYALAVLLPGIILGYMAYRGISNDQALREKESRKELEMNSQACFSEIDSSLVRFVNRQTGDSMLSGSCRYDPSILALFIKGSGGSKKLITHQLLYLPDELLAIEPIPFKPPSSLREGVRLEFIEQRLPEAIRYYEDKILQTTDSAEKNLAIIASARLYNKLNQPARAKVLYNEILTDCPGGLLNGQIPMGLIAGLETLKINQILEENDELKKNSLQCLELLLHPPCEYNSDQFEMFYQSFKNIIPESDPVFDSLFALLDKQKAITDYIVRIFIGPDLITNNKRNGLSVVPINSDELSAMYCTRNKNDGTQAGLLIDFPVFLKSISEELIRKLEPSSSINIRIEDNSGKLVFSKVLKEEAVILSFLFPENLPRYKLLLSENRPGFMTTIFKAGSGIYPLIFILIALFMLLGFAFTIYTLNVELRLNKLKSEFISNVSHELKSPLTSIRMMTDMLHHKRVETEERKSVYYSAMLEESERLSHLIDNILDFSRIDDERKKYDFTELDLDELLRKFLKSTRESLSDPGFDIRYSCTEKVPAIKADKDAILQVFYNLVDNAIKFSGSSRQIDISLSSGNSELLFCVKDYGIGIPVKDQEKIFDRFYRSNEPQRMGIRGSGIGLTIVKRIVEDHGGHLTLESKFGEGSRFTVRLPVAGT